MAWPGCSPSWRNEPGGIQQGVPRATRRPWEGQGRRVWMPPSPVGFGLGISEKNFYPGRVVGNRNGFAHVRGTAYCCGEVVQVPSRSALFPRLSRGQDWWTEMVIGTWFFVVIA